MPLVPLVRLSQIRPLDTFNVKISNQLGGEFSTMRAANLMANDRTILGLIGRIVILFGFQAIDCRQSVQHLFSLKILAAILEINMIEAAKVIFAAALVQLRYNPTGLIDVSQNLIQADLKCRVCCFDYGNIALDFFHALGHPLLLNSGNLIIELDSLRLHLLLQCNKQSADLIGSETGKVEGHYLRCGRRQWCAVE